MNIDQLAEAIGDTTGTVYEILESYGLIEDSKDKQSWVPSEIGRFFCDHVAWSQQKKHIEELNWHEEKILSLHHFSLD
jgi:3-oxoacyl-[acyl-carrier-protein] synthase III